MSLLSKNNFLSLQSCVSCSHGVQAKPPLRICSLMFLCHYHRMSSQRKDQEYKWPTRKPARIHICLNICEVSLRASAREARALSVSLQERWRQQGWPRLMAGSATTLHWHAPAGCVTAALPAHGLAPSCHGKAQGHRHSHATGQAGTQPGSQPPTNPALQGLYTMTSPGAAHDITDLVRWPCCNLHLWCYMRPSRLVWPHPPRCHTTTR